MKSKTLSRMTSTTNKMIIGPMMIMMGLKTKRSGMMNPMTQKATALNHPGALNHLAALRHQPCIRSTASVDGCGCVSCQETAGGDDDPHATDEPE